MSYRWLLPQAAVLLLGAMYVLTSPSSVSADPPTSPKPWLYDETEGPRCKQLKEEPTTKENRNEKLLCQRQMHPEDVQRRREGNRENERFFQKLREKRRAVFGEP